MSGGSYNYFFEKGAPGELEALAARLAELAPDSAAAKDTAALVAKLNDQTLRNVWQAVEWEDSNDGYDGQVRDAVDAYEGIWPQQPPLCPDHQIGARDPLTVIQPGCPQCRAWLADWKPYEPAACVAGDRAEED